MPESPSSSRSHCQETATGKIPFGDSQLSFSDLLGTRSLASASTLTSVQTTFLREEEGPSSGTGSIACGNNIDHNSSVNDGDSPLLPVSNRRGSSSVTHTSTHALVAVAHSNDEVVSSTFRPESNVRWYFVHSGLENQGTTTASGRSNADKTTEASGPSTYSDLCPNTHTRETQPSADLRIDCIAAVSPPVTIKLPEQKSAQVITSKTLRSLLKEHGDTLIRLKLHATVDLGKPSSGAAVLAAGVELVMLKYKTNCLGRFLLHYIEYHEAETVDWSLDTTLHVHKPFVWSLNLSRGPGATIHAFAVSGESLAIYRYDRNAERLQLTRHDGIFHDRNGRGVFSNVAPIFVNIENDCARICSTSGDEQWKSPQLIPFDGALIDYSVYDNYLALLFRERLLIWNMKSVRLVSFLEQAMGEDDRVAFTIDNSRSSPNHFTVQASVHRSQCRAKVILLLFPELCLAFAINLE
ncbi:hypothetical protein BGZ83_000686 [Gryganskiella cystojenkinii]|nr:hypothetical protein BGZ83_000686 [Gryganskiella cystojenkinii]